MILVVIFYNIRKIEFLYMENIKSDELELNISSE